MRAARVTEDEVRSAVRTSGIAELEQVEAVVLETDGSFSVVSPRSERAPSLEGVVLPGPGQRGSL